MNDERTTNEANAVGNNPVGEPLTDPAPMAPTAGSACFDGVHRAAVDKMAAMLFAKGVRYEPRVKVCNPHWESPPPLRKVPPHDLKMVGVKFGRFTVIGLHKDMFKTWVVRCACGDYETRTAKAINNPNNFGDRCTKCRRVAFELKRSEFQRTGRQLDVRAL